MNTKKVADIQDNGLRWTVVRHNDGINQYRLYLTFRDERGTHRKLITKYADLKSAMYHIFCSI